MSSEGKEAGTLTFGVRCPRCGEEHGALPLKRFANYHQSGYTHWVVFPALQEPVLVRWCGHHEVRPEEVHTCTKAQP